MKKHYKNIAFWTLTLLYLVVVLSFVSRKEASEYCVSIDLEMLGQAQNYFVDKHDVLDIIKENNGSVLGQPMGTIDVRSIEETLEHHSSIKNAEAFTKAGGIVAIQIEQRVPLVRVIDKYNKSYYIDEEGFIMSVSKKFTARVPIANGNIAVNWEKVRNRHISEVLASSDSAEVKQLASIYELAGFIGNHSFWSRQIQQIYYNQDKEVEIIPRIGAHIIEFGHVDNIAEKFRNLKALYDKAFRKVGWNQYRYINLKYKNQIICKKRTP